VNAGKGQDIFCGGHSIFEFEGVKCMKTIIRCLLMVFIVAIHSIAQWKQTNGPYGGEVYCIGVSGANIFAGTDQGVFLSTNNGTNWTEVNTGLPNIIVSALAVSGTNLFAGTWGDGVFLSTNNGTSWTAANTPFSRFSQMLQVDTILFSGTDEGVFLSANNGASWTKVNAGLTDTNVVALAISGINLFAGTRGGGFFLSTNNGTSWTEVNTDLTNTSVNSLAVSGTNLFAGTYAGVFVSTNNGTNWTPVNTDWQSGYVNSLVVSPNGAGGTNLFAGASYGGVFRFTDDGTNWTAVNTGLTNDYVNSLAVSGTDLFAGTLGGGVFRSTNNGTSWIAVSSGLGYASVICIAAIPDGAGGTILLAGAGIEVPGHPGFQGYCYAGGVFVSTNNGADWTPGSGISHWNGIMCFAVAPDGTGGTNLFAGTTDDGVFLSTNNGTSWTEVNTGLTNTSVSALASSGTNLFTGTSGGIFLSTNYGTSWTEVNTGLTNTSVSTLAVSGTNLFVGTWNGGVFLSTNNGASWSAVNNGLTDTSVRTLAIYGTNLFGGTWKGGVFLSTNNGTSWTAVDSGLTNTDIISLGVSGTNLFAGSNGGGVFLSTNNGTSWTAVGLDGYYIFSLIVSGSDLFASTGENFGTASGGTYLIVHSTDNGNNWNEVYTYPFGRFSGYGCPVTLIVHSRSSVYLGTKQGIIHSTYNGTTWTLADTSLTGNYIYSLALSDTNLFAATNSGIFRSTNNGTSWSAVNTPFTRFGQMLQADTNLFAVTDSGVYLSTDDGTSWRQFSSGLTDIGVSSLAVFGTNLFAGTPHGVWRRPLSDAVSSVHHIPLDSPTEFSLNQNYPNPFNPTTNFQFAIANCQFVTLKVYDLLGREVAVLVNEQKPAGRYSVTWDASRFASGIYFYRLQAGQFRETKRMMLIK
jgi:ligand-binding sensor domain-containing protein